MKSAGEKEYTFEDTGGYKMTQVRASARSRCGSGFYFVLGMLLDSRFHGIDGFATLSRSPSTLRLGSGQTFYDTCQVPFFIFFMLPGASSVEQYWPGGSFHHKAYDLSTLQK